MTKYYSLDASHRIYPIRGLLGYFHLLNDTSCRESVLIDAGLTGEMPQLSRLLKEIGLDWSGVKAILLTHGHIDHTGNLERIKRLTGAPVFAHPGEQPHIDGTFPYRGASQVCGALEVAGRWLLRYRSVDIDKPIHAGMDLPYWGGLRVVHLPGHTQGHCGFYSSRFDLLFSGDLFASYGFITHLPPAFLNSCPEFYAASLDRVTALSPKRIIPNHYSGFDGEMHRRKFDALMARRRQTKS
ncbi:MAG TPA: MBL fold metallo-hydrolase [Candidatus Angelobacter sp.]|jgi:glyoxylase-like metal-dependent hydrolase (beta-lactamase superfamily II)|nr:MBL fold metallo-hydrolase [Candidatus Angelobacter sp.]